MSPGEPQGQGPRIFAVSDLHVDYAVNRQWIESLPRTSHQLDFLVVAGDLTHDLMRLHDALSTLREKFARVLFVPGNHELWIHDRHCQHSLEKFEKILALCKSLDIGTRPERASRADGSDPVWIVPLFSWYVTPEEGCGSLFFPKPGEDPSLRIWADKYYVKWPSSPDFPRPADYFRRYNEVQMPAHFDAPVVSFSHFLPRTELIRSTPEEHHQLRQSIVDPYPEFNFSRVAGDAGLDQQIRRIGSVVHVYGHQHRNRWRPIEGVLYVSNCLGYPHRDSSVEPSKRRLWQVWGSSAGST